MVCEKEENSNHDFEKEGLEVYIEGDYIKAKNTTLGADNGIGIFNNVFETKIKIKEREISIDGKTVCSTASMKEHERPIHIVTAL